MTQHFDIVVVGGGVVGLSAAIAMRRRHLSVVVLDAGHLKVDTVYPDVRVYAINHHSQVLLQSLGVWDAMDQTRLSPYSHMHVWDSTNQAAIDFDARLVAKPTLGTIIEECVLKQALLAQAAEEGVVLYPNCKVNGVSLSLTGTRVESDAGVWETPLLIVADGAKSFTRQALGVSLNSWSYHHHAIVTTIQVEHPHQQTAWQVFNPDGPLALLPLPDTHQCSIVWSTLPSQADTLMALSDKEFGERLTQAFAAKLGACQVMSTRHCFPLVMRHAKQYSGPGWILMGDAAHTIHPLAGLGLNVGLGDLATWLRLLDKTNTPPWSNKRLGAYQRERKTFVWQVIALMEALKTVFANSTMPVTTLRGLGLQLCNAMPPFKRLLIEQAINL